VEYTILPGAHADTRWFSSWPLLGVKRRRWRVRFGLSCAYLLPTYHQQNVNKLVGIAWSWLPIRTGLPLRLGRGKWSFPWDTPAHRHSARWGWRWNPELARIELLAYCYVNGQRNWDQQLEFPVVARLACDEEAELELALVAGHYEFTCRQTDGRVSHVRVPAPGVRSTLGFSLGLFFGGALPAPQRIDLWLKTT
jgi:hypothetical protein